MNIHVVESGETIQSIAFNYGVSVERLIQDNKLPNPDNLVVGQTIVILNPRVIYTVKKGDTLESIANAFQVTQMQILQNNPDLADGNYLYEGEVLVIEYDTDKNVEISINGYASHFIETETLRRTLPYLSYLTIYSQAITEGGTILEEDNKDIIRMANDYSVASILLVTTTFINGVGGRKLTHDVLHNPQAIQNLTEVILKILLDQGYYGVNIDANDVDFGDRQLFVEMITIIAERMHAEGFQVFVTFTPNTFRRDPGVIYRGPELEEIGGIVDKVLLLSYEWGRTIRAPGEQMTLVEIRDYLTYIVEQIPTEKLSIGIPVIGYDWELPFVRGVSETQTLSFDSAINQAVETGATILYDESKAAPFYEYTDNENGNSTQHVVWFKDARSIDTLTRFVPEFGMDGIGIWNIMGYFAQLWLVVNNEYSIRKVLPMGSNTI